MSDGRALLRLKTAILELIARGESLAATAGELCLHVERLLPGASCSVLTVDRGGLIHPLAAPSLPESFSAAFEGLLVGPHVGSCGTAAYLGVPVAVQDIAHDPKWEKFKDPALALGLHACWSTPVVTAGLAQGVIGVYHGELRGPDADEQSVLELSAQLLTIALERQERVLDRERRAYLDGLTGLPNRAAFNAAIDQLPCEQPGAWALLIVDLDNLKVINDTFGHHAGDALIRTAGQRMAAAAAPDHVFRIGGDEFAIIIQSDDTLRDLDGSASRIMSAVACAADCAGHMIVPEATMGGAVLSIGDGDPDNVRQNADFALYHAKETGRGGFVRYWPGIGTRMIRRRDAIRDMAMALGQGHVDAFYQPIVRLDTREIVGVEALCRVLASDGGILSTTAVRDSATDVHVAADLTARMMAIIASDVRLWRDRGVPFGRVGVNISSADLRRGWLSGQLCGILDDAGIPLACLELEVAEGVYRGPADRAVAREVQALRRQGFRIALDDFGTGPASLTNLIAMPVDVIKLDRLFVRQLHASEPTAAIVGGLIALAERLGIEISAEGIETEEEVDALLSLGCRWGQGLVFCDAVDRAGATDLLLRHADGTGRGGLPFADRATGVTSIAWRAGSG